MRKIVCMIIVGAVLGGCSVFHGSRQGKILRQQKTVDAIRDIGTAVEAYKLVAGVYPVLTTGYTGQLEPLLVPKYLAKFPAEDGWGNKIEYYCMQPEGPYYIISLGSDEERDVGLYKSNRLPAGVGFNVITSMKEDIIFSNGVFVRYPEGSNLTASK